MSKCVRRKRLSRAARAPRRPPSALYNMVKAAPFEAAAVAAVGCTDTAGWRNQFGADCASMVADGHCKDGAFVADHEWAAGPDYGSPEKNCCACGKEIACVDTSGWHNQFAATCATYASEKHCVDGGFVPANIDSRPARYTERLRTVVGRWRAHAHGARLVVQLLQQPNGILRDCPSEGI